MANQTVRGVFIPRHDIAENWAKAKNFIPAKGELIVYDADTTTYGPTTSADSKGNSFTYESSSLVRMKFGDGERNVNLLPFVTTGAVPGGSSSDIVLDTAGYKITTFNYSEENPNIGSTSFPYPTTNPEALLVFHDYALLLPEDATDSQDPTVKHWRYSTAEQAIEFIDGHLIQAGDKYIVVEMKGVYAGSGNTTRSLPVNSLADLFIAVGDTEFNITNPNTMIMWTSGEVINLTMDPNLGGACVIIKSDTTQNLKLTLTTDTVSGQCLYYSDGGVTNIDLNDNPVIVDGDAKFVELQIVRTNTYAFVSATVIA